MATILLVKEAIAELKERTGSSVLAITKWITSEKKTDLKKHVLRAALKRGVADGTLVQVKASYKLSPEAKKATKKKTAPKKKTAAKKKPTTTTKKKTKTTASKKKPAAAKKNIKTSKKKATLKKKAPTSTKKKNTAKKGKVSPKQ